jgi:nicotinamidase-related amidase
MAVWDAFLTEDDKKVLAKRRPRSRTGLGSSPAVLVVDMQVTACGHDKPIYDQLDEFPGACGPHAWNAIRAQQVLLAGARKAGVKIVYSKHLFRPESGLAGADPSSNFSSLNPNSEVPVEVAMQPGDLLVEKQRASCFFHTGLIYLLQNAGIDSLIVVGNSTSGCVRATVIDAMGYGIKCQVVEEGTFDRIEMSHAASLFDLQFKYCDVISLDEAMTTFEAIRAARGSVAVG